MNQTLAVSPWIVAQGQLFLTGILAGAIVWVLYDLLRLWRRILPRGVVWVAVEDVVFFFLCAMVGFEFLYPQSLGQVKGFLVLAFLVGSVLYQYLVGRHLIRTGSKVIHRVKKRIQVFRQKRGKNKKESTKYH